MRKVFVSHPLSGDFPGNRAKVDKICREIAARGYLPISPLHMFSFYDRENGDIRDAILELCFKLIDLCDEVWVYGISDGCLLEAAYAKLAGKPVVQFSAVDREGS